MWIKYKDEQNYDVFVNVDTGNYFSFEKYEPNDVAQSIRYSLCFSVPNKRHHVIFTSVNFEDVYTKFETLQNEILGQTESNIKLTRSLI